MHDRDRDHGLGSLHPEDAYERKLSAERVPSIAAAAAPDANCRSRSPGQLRDELGSFAAKFADGGPERRLLSDASEALWRLERQLGVDEQRAYRAERIQKVLLSKIELARFALNAQAPD